MVLAIDTATKHWFDRQINKVISGVSPKFTFKEELTLAVTKAALNKEFNAYDTSECDKIANNINQMVERLLKG